MNRSRDKGNRIEREMVHRHLDNGVFAERVPLSGSAGGSFSGDLRIGELRGEVKARQAGQGFKTLERWLGDNDLLFLRRDRAEPIVVMEWQTYMQIMREREGLYDDEQTDRGEPQQCGIIYGADNASGQESDFLKCP